MRGLDDENVFKIGCALTITLAHLPTQKTCEQKCKRINRIDKINREKAKYKYIPLSFSLSINIRFFFLSLYLFFSLMVMVSSPPQFLSEDRRWSVFFSVSSTFWFFRYPYFSSFIYIYIYMYILVVLAKFSSDILRCRSVFYFFV